MLAIVDETGRIQVYRTSDWSHQHTYHSVAGQVVDFQFSMDGKTMAACGRNSQAGFITIWNLDNQSERPVAIQSTPVPTQIVFTASEAGVFTRSEGDNVISLWHLAERRKMKDYRSDLGRILSLSATWQRDHVATGRDNGRFDIITMTRLPRSQ